MNGSWNSTGSREAQRVRRSRRAKRTLSSGLLAVAVIGGVLTPVVTASAAATDVVINELMFNPVSGVDGDEFLELRNTGATPVDLSGWCFTGITLCFPSGTTIAAGAFLVVGKDAARFQLTYGSPPAAIYTGGLSNGGEAITLRDAGAIVIDTVAYVDRDPWPTITDGSGPSLELINATLDNNDPLNWAAATSATGGSPGSANSVTASGLKPRISAVTATPNVPAVNQPVTITATVSGQTSALVRYRVDFGGLQTTPMTANGDGTFSATLPGAAAGHLIRYRVEATNADGTNTSPRVDDSSQYKGVVVANGVNSAIPVLEWFIADADYNLITAYPTVDISRPAVIAYNGQVFDNAQVNIRGQTTQTGPKPNWKIEMPKNHDITLAGLVGPVDEFAMQADYSDNSHGRPLLAWDSYATAGVVQSQVMPIRTQRNAQFQGLYTYVDLFDGTWRDRTGYSNKQFFKAGSSGFDSTAPIVERRFEKKNPEDYDFTGLSAFLNGINLTGNAQRNHLLANANLPQMINYAVVTAIVQHTDSSSKNFYLSQDPVNGRWSIIPWDLDHSWGNTCCGVTSTFVTPAETGDRTSPLMRAILAVPEWRQMYFRRLRSVVDQVLAPGRLEGIYDAKVGPAEPESTLDFVRWPRSSNNLSYAGMRRNLFADIQDRRDVFANDSRVPAAQGATPNIVINEIQHSPAAGDAAEFVELYNPSATVAVDVSGWRLAGGIDLPQIQPGTVIAPGGTMTFVKDDLTFRATAGSSAFVGGVFTGDLAASESLQLLRTDGSTADTLTYGGAGWPVSSDGRSLELVNPASDNADGANWALSTLPAGSPGAANQATVTATTPGAPTVGNAVAGGVSATVNWTAPTNTGGSTITGYQIKVLDTVGTQVGGLRPAAPNTTSVIVTGLTAGTPYRFQVSAINVAGVGTASGLSNSVTPVALAAPNAPAIGSASSGTAGGGVNATARWSAPSSVGSSAVLGYFVRALQMSSTAGNATVVNLVEAPIRPASARSYQISLVPGIYRFEVVAINATGASPFSVRSNAVTAQ